MRKEQKGSLTTLEKCLPFSPVKRQFQKSDFQVQNRFYTFSTVILFAYNLHERSSMSIKSEFNAGLLTHASAIKLSIETVTSIYD